MAVSIFTRCSHLRRFIGMSNNAAILFPNTAQHLNHVQQANSRSHTMSVPDNDIFEFDNKPNKSNKKMSKAMLAYMQRTKKYDEFMRKEITEFEIGKRHLANMMGEDADTFTQEDINRAIEYLFPSALFESKARPMMQHPNEIFPSKKASEFDESGRPFHSMFYTSKPNYYEVLYNITDKIQSLNNIEDSFIKQGTLPMDNVDLIGSSWLTKLEIEKVLLENISDQEYMYFITSLERLCNHPLSNREINFIMEYRRKLVTHANQTVVQPLEYDKTGRPYIIVKNCMRKNARGEVTIWGNGSGKITINGQDITYFEDNRHREQVVEPNKATRGAGT